MTAAMSHADSKRMYSWWWDSHISPKNSKWLQENLTDMDAKVKQMIKLIEEDADSFARRAEMYYKKRPELMNLVEEFYRAYRALAERYDHATGVIRQAHHTMAEAFPNQVPPVLTDELLTEPHTPETQKDASNHLYAIKRNGAYTDEHDSDISRKGLKQFNDLFISGEPRRTEGRARRGLNFHEMDEIMKNNGIYDDTKSQVLSESERLTKAEEEILALKIALERLETEKETGLFQYQQSMERLSNLESEVSHARENSQGLDERTIKAETEVQTLKEALTKLQAEKEACLVQYQQCLEKLSNLEKNISCAQKDVGELNKRASRAETEAESLHKDLYRVEAEKEAALVQYNQSLEKVSKLEEGLVHAEEKARRTNEQANVVKNEIEAMKLEITKLTQENEDAVLRHRQCLEIISGLEHKLYCAEEEVRKLNCKIADGVEKLQSSEQECDLLETSNQTLQSEFQSLAQKMGSQSEELTEKRKELSRLWTCIQEERLRFIEAETSFQTLQNLHSQSQEELRSLASELHNKAEFLENMESCKNSLEKEIQRVKKGNKILNELRLSSSLSIQNFQDEILNLRETIEELEHKVGLRIDERNTLQQEIYCLEEELNDVNKRYESMMEEVGSTGLDSQCFASSVKKLQDENSKLKEKYEVEKCEKAALVEKLEILESLSEKSISDLNTELNSVNGKVKVLEESCKYLLDEKATLFSQLKTTTDKLEMISEKNSLLENSLFDVNSKLEGLRVKSKISEDNCMLLDHEKYSLNSEKETLVSQLKITRQTLKDLEKKHYELELKHSELKAEKESALQRGEELLVSLYSERVENSRIVKFNEGYIADKELQIHVLQENARHRKKEYEEELDRAVHTQTENFILQKCIHDLEQKNFSILVDCQRLLEASKMSDRLVSELENENVQKQVDMNSMSEKTKILRIGLLQVLKTLGLNDDHLCQDMIEEDQELLNHIHGKLHETQNHFVTVFNERERAMIENSVFVTFLRQLKLNAENLVAERDSLDMELRIQSNQFLALQEEVQKILEKNQELKLAITKGDEKMKVMNTEIENLCKQLSDLEVAHKNTLEESCKTVEEKNCLIRRLLDLGEEKGKLEEEVCLMIHDIIVQSNLSLILQEVLFEKFVALEKVSSDLGKLCFVNTNLEERLKIMASKLEDGQMENSHLKESFVVSNVELKLLESVNDQLNCQMTNGKELLSRKENDILKAAEMISALRDEKTELQRLVEDLKSKYDEARVILADQATQILNLSSDKDRENEKLACLYEVNQKLEAEMQHLCQELGETKLREEKLSSELQNGANEIEQLETQADMLYAGLQISAVNETLFEGKARELDDACKNLELRSDAKDMYSEMLKERVMKLEGENRRLHGQLAAYVPAASALNDCITSLEMQIVVHANPHDYKESKAKILANPQYTEGGPQTSENQNATAPDALPNLQDMWKRINAIEMAVKQMSESSKPKDEMREIQVLKSGTSQTNIQVSKHVTQMDEAKVHQGRPSAELKPKDIMLDQMTECSSYGISMRGILESDDRILELWETADKDRSIGLKVGKIQTQKTATAYGSYHVEKEKFGVDKLVIPRRRLATQTHHEEDGNKRKVLERLDYDAQKLTNLEITVQDLMTKVEISEESSTMRKGIEYDSVKDELEAAKETITKLFDTNHKLMRKVESVTDSDENGSMSRRRILEQAQRGSEKIRRLQLEVQRLQFLLLKLNDERKGKGKTMVDDQNSSVLLRDYLYEGTRVSYQKRKKKKKGHFCACMQPPTKGD
ncbi:hypothetical protein TanjilG_06415 [Lupinus angustifolius]|uniref:NAB domain-containing protein n=1 Tax=Lupinus angustifolius TaxID=3871 RepID=A0A1J7HWX2_LUPAN|nr:PREDICTED: protein NETWORKED 1D-like [Lupinus angustifolius]XP_019456115.1 PREDICTED: protein NETWORKED 1D-like [Lupinus angustifolius]OIW05003.1 hypothetical protein TanjilG_06415 [Lupinus angustifolius]